MNSTIFANQRSLEEVRQSQPELEKLYQLTGAQGQVVMQFRSVNGSEVWRFPGPPQFSVRSKASVFQQLTTEEHLLKDVEITSVLSKDAKPGYLRRDHPGVTVAFLPRGLYEQTPYDAICSPISAPSASATPV